MAHERNPKIVIESVSKWYVNDGKPFCALQDISLKVYEGEFVCLVGPSGCGKTTLLNLIAGLDHPTSGRIWENGHPVVGPGEGRMMMFQESALFPWLNVLDNVLFGINLKPNLTKNEKKEIALFYLRLVGLENFRYANIHELSGGMKQRVALARSLAPDPQVLLMDEPFASLDALTREQFYGDIQEIWRETKKTIILVTHNVAEAVCLGEKVILFSRNPGYIKEKFDIDLPRPRDIRSMEVAKLATDITHVLRKHMQEIL